MPINFSYLELVGPQSPGETGPTGNDLHPPTAIHLSASAYVYSAIAPAIEAARVGVEEGVGAGAGEAVGAAAIDVGFVAVPHAVAARGRTRVGDHVAGEGGGHVARGS